MNLPARINDVAQLWKEERRGLVLRIAELRAELAQERADNYRLVQDNERLRRELDEEQGVLR